MDAGINKKKKEKDTQKRYPKISLTGNFIIYIAVFTAALIFTQALRSKASNIFFGFIFFLPLAMLIYIITARAALKITLLSDSATIAKLEPYSYSFRVINESIIPYPFIDAMMRLPQTDSVRCTDRTVRFAMSPFASYDIKNTVKFKFRGTYNVGVNCIYVYDFFKIIRIRIDVDAYSEASVLPRRMLILNKESSAVSDSAKETKKDPSSYEKIEISDIRDYRSGDPLKSIHWKLSSKAEDFIVRDYDTGASKKTFVYCDMSARFPDEAPPEEIPAADAKSRKKKKSKDKEDSTEKNPKTEAPAASHTSDDENSDIRAVSDEELRSRAEAHAAVERAGRRRKSAKAARENRLEIDAAQDTQNKTVDVHKLSDDKYYSDMNEYCADGIVELTVAVVLRELKNNNECTLLWFDSRSESGLYSITLRGIEDFDAAYKLFATSPLCPIEESVDRLSLMVSDTQDVKQLYVTSAADPEAIKLFCALPGVADGNMGATEIILFNPEERFAHVSERKLYIEGCRAQLLSKGLKLTEGRID